LRGVQNLLKILLRLKKSGEWRQNKIFLFHRKLIFIYCSNKLVLLSKKYLLPTVMARAVLSFYAPKGTNIVWEFTNSSFSSLRCPLILPSCVAVASGGKCPLCPLPLNTALVMAHHGPATLLLSNHERI